MHDRSRETVGRILDAAAEVAEQRGYDGAPFPAAAPLVDKPLYAVLHTVKSAFQDNVAPQALFGDLGIKYVGLIDSAIG